MESNRQIDYALATATNRTIEAQDDVLQVLEAEKVPPLPLVSKVAYRAEDTHLLAEEAASHAAVPDETE